MYKYCTYLLYVKKLINRKIILDKDNGTIVLLNKEQNEKNNYSANINDIFFIKHT